VLAPLSAEVVDDSGAEPHPAGSLAVTAAAVVAAASVLVPHVAAASSVTAGVSVAGPSDELERFTYAVMSDPVGTIATISHPSPDFSVSFAASEEAS
jgi:hypothetical protein